MDKLLIIGGPTAVGKTQISVMLAQKLNGEIISADSMQIYKYMNIGSAKITKDEMKSIPHYMIDVIEPGDNFTAADFKQRALNIINDITGRGKLPMIVGGTGLYIDSVIFDYDFTNASGDEEYRKYLEDMALIRGKEYVHSLLKGIDNESYEKIHPNNLKKVIRALEVYKVSGKPISEANCNKKANKIPYDIRYFVLTMDRAKLYERINHRVDLMIDNGLIDEVKNLKNMRYTENMQSMQGIGYKEIFLYLNGKITLEHAIEMIKQGSRNYAKRQLTWFRKNKNIEWIKVDDYDSIDEIISKIELNINS